MNRINKLFKDKKDKILSIYFTAGYPNLNDTTEIIKTLDECGVDLIEIGMPFSDPIADGPVIQDSSNVAIDNGMNLNLLFKQLEEIRNINQKMFESRLFFVDKLIDMGAQIILCDPHRATVIGLDRKIPLKGIQMTSPDIRAGVSLLIAALSANGTSIIDNIDQIDRGYSNIDQRLRELGADIERI
jgi:hypothetical protein